MKTQMFPVLAASAAALHLLTGCAAPLTSPPPAVAVAAAPAKSPARAVPRPGDAERLIPLQGALNVRTFDGLRGKAGPIPAASFVRAADLHRLSAADRDTLAARGVRLGLDLRTAEEDAGAADPLAADDRFEYRRISLLGAEKIDLEKLPDDLGTMYVQSLRQSPAQFRDVFDTIAAQPDGTVLFHCTAGKDRTGMVAALLLSLAGVPRSDIVHDYAISAHYLGPMFDKDPKIAEMVRQNPKIAAMMGTPAESIEAFLDALEREHGGARAYLRKIGVSDTNVAQLMARLGQMP
jgi:protein-tyrosine phosphatase